MRRGIKPRKKTNILANVRFLVAIGAGFLLLMGITLVAQGRVDTERFRNQIIATLKEKTGKDVAIRGTVSVSLLPVPTIYVPGVELRDSGNDETPTPSITVDMVRVFPSIATLFSEHPQISGVALQHPILELVRARDKEVHWDWLNTGLLRALSGKGEQEAAISVEIIEGSVVYHDNVTDKGFTAENIYAKGTAGDRPRVNGGLSVSGHDMRFALDTNAGAAPAPEGTVPLNVRVYTDDKNSVKLAGGLDMSGDTVKIKGAFSLETEDVLAWLQAKTEEKTNLLKQVTNESATKDVKKTLLPMKFSCDWAQEGLNLDLSKVQLEGLNSAGAGIMSLAWQGQQPSTTVSMEFSALDYNQWATLLTTLYADHTASASAGFNGEDQQDNPLPKDETFNLNISAQKLYVGSQVWEKAAMQATLADATVTVNQFTISLPGQSDMTLFGVISQGSTGGMRFEGSMETKGKSLRQLFTVFDESAGDLPENTFGEFYARSNIFVSPEQVRLSEADVKINELRLNGGLVAYFDANPRMEADVKLKDINFDYFRDVWRENQKKAEHKDFFLKFDKTTSFNWLRKLKTNIDFKVVVDQFTFLERKGDSASFRLFAKEGEFGIYNIHFQYPNQTTEANFTLDVKGETPAINVVLNTNEINTDYFNVTKDETAKAPPADGAKALSILPQAEKIVVDAQGNQAAVTPPPVGDPQLVAPVAIAAAPAEKRWSEDLIDMSWMEGLSGTFDITIGKLISEGRAFNNLKLQARLDNNLVSFQTLSFDYWQGRCSVLGSIYGGKVPGISVSFTLFDAELADIFKSLADRTNITGRASISGTLAASGVNYLSWISQSDAKLVIAARGVVVNGLNLQGVVNAVTVARTASDVFNNVNLELGKGSTEFSVDGNLNIKNGVIKTPGIGLNANTITGNLTGEISLIPWTMELSTFFQFPAMTSETVPTMTVQLTGPIASPDLKTDTASLEAYVAKRIVGR